MLVLKCYVVRASISIDNIRASISNFLHISLSDLGSKCAVVSVLFETSKNSSQIKCFYSLVWSYRVSGYRSTLAGGARRQALLLVWSSMYDSYGRSFPIKNWITFSQKSVSVLATLQI